MPTCVSSSPRIAHHGSRAKRAVTLKGGLLDVADDYRDDVAHDRVEIVAPAAEALLAEVGVELPAEELQQLLREWNGVSSPLRPEPGIAY